MDELLYTQEDIDEWIRTCEELQDYNRELKEELSDLQCKYNLLAQENTQLKCDSETLTKSVKYNRTKEIFNRLMEIYKDNPIVLERHLQDVFKNEWGVELNGSEN